jgi:homoserine kinase
MPTLSACRVRVPCSTSNLGSGFDTLGLALDRYLRASFRPDGGLLRLERSGTLADLGVPPMTDLLASTFRRMVEASGALVEGTIRVTSEIPVGRGLGSSAAALVAGYALARGALGARTDKLGAFAWATAREGHGDNAGPCALGGFHAVVPGPKGPRTLSLPLSQEIGFAFAAPSTQISTSDARDVLPRMVPHRTAAISLGRLTSLLEGIARGDAELISEGMVDDLHVPHRLPLIPGGAEAVAAGYRAGAWGVTVSGSGSGLIALCPREDGARVADAMRQVFADRGEESQAVGWELRPDMDGVVQET